MSIAYRRPSWSFLGAGGESSYPSLSILQARRRGVWKNRKKKGTENIRKLERTVSVSRILRVSSLMAQTQALILRGRVYIWPK